MNAESQSTSSLNGNVVHFEPQASVAIVDLADELNVRKQWIFKIAKRLDIKTQLLRQEQRGNQLVATVSSTEALAIRREIDASLRRRAESSEGSDGPVDAYSEAGYFYLALLEPEHDPGRLKVGFTTDMDGRLQKHRCSAPFTVFTKSWPCLRTWERAAIDCLTDGLEKLRSEVFRAASVVAVEKRGDAFFSVMPRLTMETDDGQDKNPGQPGF